MAGTGQKGIFRLTLGFFDILRTRKEVEIL